jgi:hypothetical protein
MLHMSVYDVRTLRVETDQPAMLYVGTSSDAVCEHCLAVVHSLISRYIGEEDRGLANVHHAAPSSINNRSIFTWSISSSASEESSVYFF